VIIKAVRAIRATEGASSLQQMRVAAWASNSCDPSARNDPQRNRRCRFSNSQSRRAAGNDASPCHHGAHASLARQLRAHTSLRVIDTDARPLGELAARAQDVGVGQAGVRASRATSAPVMGRRLRHAGIPRLTQAMATGGRRPAGSRHPAAPVAAMTDRPHHGVRCGFSDNSPATQFRRHSSRAGSQAMTDVSAAVGVARSLPYDRAEA
jgi:hypothetical protein